MSRRTKLVLAALLVLLVLGGAGAAVAIKVHHDNQVTARHRVEAAARARAAAARRASEEQARASREAQEHQREAETHERESLEKGLETAITKDAQHRTEENTFLEGPIKSTTCTPTSGGSSQDLSQSTGTYSCLAVNKVEGDGTQSGYRFTGTINFKTGSYTWRLGG
jgi:Tfp pilus assembly protein PilX